MNEKEYNWHKIAGHINELNFASTNIAMAEMMGKKICIAKFKEQFFAFAFKCPHAGGIMADGHIDALGNVVCPVHRYKYSLQNGFNISGEGYFLKHWPVKLQKNGVYVGTEERDGFINLFQ